MDASCRNLARSRVSIAPAPQPARLREVRASEANTCSLHHRTPFVPAQIKPNPQRRDSIRGGFLPLAANEVQDGRCGAVRSIEDSSGVGCRTVVVIDGRQLPSGAKWTTRFACPNRDVLVSMEMRIAEWMVIVGSHNAAGSGIFRKIRVGVCRSPQQHTASFCTLALRSNFHKDVLVKVIFCTRSPGVSQKAHRFSFTTAFGYCHGLSCV